MKLLEYTPFLMGCAAGSFSALSLGSIFTGRKSFFPPTRDGCEREEDPRRTAAEICMAPFSACSGRI